MLSDFFQVDFLLPWQRTDGSAYWSVQGSSVDMGQQSGGIPVKGEGNLPKETTSQAGLKCQVVSCDDIKIQTTILSLRRLSQLIEADWLMYASVK